MCSLCNVIVNACARGLGSRAGPRTGKEEREFLQKKGRKGPGGGGGGGREVKGVRVPGEGLRGSLCAGGTLHGIGLQLLQAMGGPTGRGGGGGCVTIFAWEEGLG